MLTRKPTLLMAAFALMISACAHADMSRDPRQPRFIYEIFTRSFTDLNTIQSKLDYIAGLGADTIWLTPIFRSPSYHGYDVSDYQSIQPDFGDLPAFQSLLSAAHSHGIKILLDVPVNHTSIAHPWFTAGSDFYLWSATPLDWPKISLKKDETPEDHWHLFSGSYYFSSFSFGMPDLNWHNPAVLSNVEQVFQYWTGLGVDGFRLDAAMYLIKGPQGERNQPGTHAIWKQIAASTHKNAPNAYFVGEVWDSEANISQYYGNGDELDAAFNFPVEGALRSSLTSGNSASFVQALNTQLKTELNPFFDAPFAGNHDQDRLATVLGGDSDLQKLAELAVMTLPGTPVLYYGDELGMKNSAAMGDLAKRAPMDWGAEKSQDSDHSSILNFFRALGRMRNAQAVLNSGTIENISTIGTSGATYLRVDSTVSGAPQHALMILNFGDQPLAAQTFAIASTQPSFKVIWGSPTATWSRLRKKLTVSPIPAKSGTVITY
jgi:alpha-amylase